MLAYLGFASLGLPDGLLGVAWPSMRADFGVPVGAVGFVLTLATTGYLISSVGAGFILGRLGVGWLLVASTAAVGVALAGFGAAPVFWVAVVSALLLGLGSGAIDSGLNAHAAAYFSARHMNWMHACFGVGATLGPLAITGVLAAGLAWRWGYGLVAAAQALIAVVFVLTVGVWRDTRSTPVASTGEPAVSAKDPAVPRRRTWSMPAAWMGVLIFALYTAVEIGAGLWAYTLLTEARGMADGLAGLCVSAYWASLLVGRVLYGLVAERLRSRPVVLVCLVVVGVGAGLLAVPGSGWVAAAGLILMGGFAAPVFPLLTLTTAERVGAEHADQAIGMQMGAAGLGGAVIPAGVGVVLGWFGAGVLGIALVLLTAATIAACLATPHRAVVNAGDPAIPGGTTARSPQ